MATSQDFESPVVTPQDSEFTGRMNGGGTTADTSRSNGIRSSIYHDSLSDTQYPLTHASASNPNSPVGGYFPTSFVEARLPNGEPAEQTATAPVDQPNLQNGGGANSDGVPNSSRQQSGNHDPMAVVVTLLRATISHLARTDLLTEGFDRAALIRIIAMLQGLLQLDSTLEKTDRLLRRFSGELLTVSLSIRRSEAQIQDDTRFRHAQNTEESSEASEPNPLASASTGTEESVSVPTLRRIMEWFNLQASKDLALVVVGVVLWSVGISLLAVILDRSFGRRN